MQAWCVRMCVTSLQSPVFSPEAGPSNIGGHRKLGALEEAGPLGSVGSSSFQAPNIGGHRNLFYRKTMLPFGSHQAPLPCAENRGRTG